MTKSSPRRTGKRRDKSRELHPVRAYRTRHRLTLAQLGERAGLSESGLSRIESGHSSPDSDVILRLAMATEGEVSEIDIWRYHAAVQTGVVPPFRAPATATYQWNWVQPQVGAREPEPAAA